ncbi:ABC transporter substrate-binding protein [Azospirillum doebereinerae]|uniref:ABC transporter substrate-binding protein n=1 Tax=Azospirillum doebereinerae TaxID=92933 RepID=A0A3S0WLC2_9PROT|nr:ABC transporter substrate-binding protein [Azospirillum doebereinerae]MCG5243231.1 ABC transporter substrate-binding protein [Azospirillum doebereinerae]RUQ69707.1 ABC transporter substrate-binding protein [Azospirillum doebereinerae]
MLGRRDLIAAAATLALAIPFVGPSAGALAQQPPIRIALIGPMSGTGAFEGQLGLEGAQAAAAIINAKGGVAGRKLELLNYDDKGSPEDGVSAAKRAIEQDNVDFIIGGWFSAVALSMKEVTRDKIITVMTSSQHPKVTEEGHKYLFRLNATSAMMSNFYSKAICGQIKPKSIAFMNVNDDWGRLELDNYTKLLGECGIEIKGHEFYNRTDTDFTTALTKLKALNPDAIYVAAINTSQGATIYRQVRQTGFRGKVIASAGNMNPKLVELSGNSLESVYSASPFVEDNGQPSMKPWLAEYRKSYKNEPSFIAALGAQGVELIAAGVAGTGGDPRAYDKIAAYLKANETPTVLGNVRFSDQGQATQPIHLVQVKSKQIVAVRD